MVGKVGPSQGCRGPGNNTLVRGVSRAPPQRPYQPYSKGAPQPPVHKVVRAPPRQSLDEPPSKRAKIQALAAALTSEEPEASDLGTGWTPSAKRRSRGNRTAVRDALGRLLQDASITQQGPPQLTYGPQQQQPQPPRELLPQLPYPPAGSYQPPAHPAPGWCYQEHPWSADPRLHGTWWDPRVHPHLQFY